ncbi:MAG TPA: HD domain-containing protein [Pyrinomonadaceae bacterium]|nr:HD domain-containing protein [Pyrinomonadaceae bacterium]
MEKIPEKVIAISSAIRESGGRALLVGGCVRDQLMSLEPTDWDLEIYEVEPAMVRSILDQFGPVNVVGESFTVYKLGSDIDVSLPRRERKVGRGHRAFVVEGDPGMSVVDATRRRDFTINAILKDPITGEIIDPYDGRKDIETGVLRAVAAETFPEDSLRVLRAAQLASRFQFDIDDKTVELCRTIDLDDLPCERIWGEIEKLLLRSHKPSIGLRHLRELLVIDKLFPEIKRLIGVRQDPVWHPEGDVFVHTQLVIDVARQLIDELPYAKKVTVMLAALAHDFGKPATTKFQEGHWRSLGHAEAGVGATERFLDRLNIHTIDNYDVRTQVVALVKDHLKPGEFFKKRDEVGEGAFRRLARRCEPDLLYRVAKADSLGRNAEWVPKEKWFNSEAQEWFIERARELQVDSGPPQPLLLGRHLLEMGLEPGIRIGEITAAIYEMQLDGRVRSVDEAKNAAKVLLGIKQNQN